ncbi:hypothetical protein P8452_55398 [Trifolium repens]|nr:hypothetical protein P8452_55398 [Trifolium repens]
MNEEENKKLDYKAGEENSISKGSRGKEKKVKTEERAPNLPDDQDWEKNIGDQANIGTDDAMTLLSKMEDNGLCLEGLFDDAMTLLSKMEDNGCIPDAVTYQTIIYALFENDENYKAEKLLREMVARRLL